MNSSPSYLGTDLSDDNCLTLNKGRLRDKDPELMSMSTGIAYYDTGGI